MLRSMPILLLLSPSTGCPGSRRETGDDHDIEDEIDLETAAWCESIAGDLRCHHEDWLTRIELPCLTSVGGDLRFGANASLTHVDGLSGIATVGGDLLIWYNESLTSLAGMASLTTVGGDLRIYDNPCVVRKKPRLSQHRSTSRALSTCLETTAPATDPAPTRVVDQRLRATPAPFPLPSPFPTLSSWPHHLR